MIFVEVCILVSGCRFGGDTRYSIWVRVNSEVCVWSRLVASQCVQLNLDLLWFGVDLSLMSRGEDFSVKRFFGLF